MDMESNSRQDGNTPGSSSQNQAESKSTSVTDYDSSDDIQSSERHNEDNYSYNSNEDLHFDINTRLLDSDNRIDGDVFNNDNNDADNNDDLEYISGDNTHPDEVDDDVDEDHGDGDDDDDDDNDDDNDDDDDDDDDDHDDDHDEEDEEDNDDNNVDNENDAGGVHTQNHNNSNVFQHTPFLTINNNPSLQLPLIAKRNITAKDHVLAAVATSVRHKLTFEATIDQLKWIKSMYHTNAIPTTKEKFWEFLDRNDDVLTFHYYCRNCREYLGKKCEKQMNCKKCICDENDDLESNLRYFINISLTAQIEELLSLPNISIKWKPSNSSEVTSRFIVTTCSVDAPC
ncbi:hypothetical protein KQX54_012354 [Cotesia glomerata]|uniref:Uncharacterized protein n=1 Tax=Cotesia glomerata TaxID=32391 RepID=A0AAV7IYF8_COTGL|nr:hypothetical protein KQX54_012354 [Cotesia glomerata]